MERGAEACGLVSVALLFWCVLFVGVQSAYISEQGLWLGLIDGFGVAAGIALVMTAVLLLIGDGVRGLFQLAAGE